MNPAAPIQPPQGEAYPNLRTLVLLANAVDLLDARFEVFRNRLRTLLGPLHGQGHVESEYVHTRVDAVRWTYHQLQSHNVWDVTNEPVFSVAMSEILVTFPVPPPAPAPVPAPKPAPVAGQNNLGNALAAAGGGALVAAGAAVVLPAIAVSALGVVGFSAIVPVAGTLAPLIQSTVYAGAVPAGSAFALAQAAAMGGIVVGSAAEVVAGACAVVAGAGVLRNAANQGGDAEGDAAGEREVS